MCLCKDYNAVTPKWLVGLVFMNTLTSVGHRRQNGVGE